MTIKELLPILPKYPDSKYFDVTVNTVSKNCKNVTKFNSRCYDSFNLDQLLETESTMLNQEIEKITSGKCLVGGDFDDSLQIWLKD